MYSDKVKEVARKNIKMLDNDSSLEDVIRVLNTLIVAIFEDDLSVDTENKVVLGSVGETIKKVISVEKESYEDKLKKRQEVEDAKAEIWALESNKV